MSSKLGSFFRELNRRHVTQTALIYVVAGLGVIEFIDIVAPVFGISVGVEALLIKLVVGGLPFALGCAWLFQIGDGGIRFRQRERAAGSRVIAIGLFAALVFTTGFGIMLLPTPEAPGPVEPAGQAAGPRTGESGADLPQITIHTPAEWAGGGTRGFAASPRASIRVSGLARYQDGIREVLANNKRMAIQRDPSNPSIVQFSGFVEPPAAGSSGEVEILVRGRDGSQTVRAYAVKSNPAPAVTNTGAQLAEVAGAKNRQRWAVVIGVSDYLDDNIGDLQYADDDALAIHDFLRSPSAGMGGIPEDHIRLLINEEATSRNIRSALTTFLRGSTPDDVIFIYIAGHGTPDPYRPDDLYLVANDTEVSDLAATGIAMGDLAGWVADWYAYNRILMIDVTHFRATPPPSVGDSDMRGTEPSFAGIGTRSLAGNPINSAFLDYMNSSSGGFVTFTASESNQLSQEGEQYGGGHGVFTHFLLEGLGGEADEDGDYVITLGEAMEYTRNAVRRETRNAQVPTISQTTFDRFWPMAAVLDP